MTNTSESDRSAAEHRFAAVFGELDFIVRYARHRGARDPDGVAAEAMAIAWRRLADVPTDDPRPWLIVTTRNLLHAEHRRATRLQTQPLDGIEIEAPADHLPSEDQLDQELVRALRQLSDSDREALLLVAWDDLSPALAARSLGISGPTFRVRLHRARRRLGTLLSEQVSVSPMTSTQQNWSHVA